jgi:hypothetical protein
MVGCYEYHFNNMISKDYKKPLCSIRGLEFLDLFTKLTLIYGGIYLSALKILIYQFLKIGIKCIPLKFPSSFYFLTKCCNAENTKISVSVS